MLNQFDATKFAIACKVWRNMHTLTNRDMAELAAIPPSTYNFIENGQRCPTMAEFSNLCQLMQFDAQFFFVAPQKAKNDGR